MCRMRENFVSGLEFNLSLLDAPADLTDAAAEETDGGFGCRVEPC